MPLLDRGDTSDCSDPQLDLYTMVGGVLTDIYQLEFQIFEKVTTPATPIQVYPSSGRQSVDLSDCPTGDRIGTGHYVAAWTVPDAEPIGTHEVRWFFKLTSTSAEQSYVEEFDVQSAAGALAPAEYCTIADIRDEGVSVAYASDARVQARIQIASKQLEKACGRWFEARAMTLLLDGRGSPELLLDIPIIDVTQVRYVDRFGNYADITLTDLAIYNRHITENLTDPDDRDNPRLAWVASLPGERWLTGYRWPIGKQNIQVDGVFGYTDPDGSTYGTTPALIRHACKLLVVRSLDDLGDLDARDDSLNRGLIQSLRTRDQSITYRSGAGASGVATVFGDREVDQIVAMYARPPRMRAV